MARFVCSELDIYNYNKYLIEVGVMHEAEYVFSGTPSTLPHMDIFTSVQFLIYGISPLNNAHMTILPHGKLTYVYNCNAYITIFS